MQQIYRLNNYICKGQRLMTFGDIKNIILDFEYMLMMGERLINSQFKCFPTET